MLENRIPLFRMLGIRISLDLSWFLLALLLTWSLARGYFPWAAPGLDGTSYWAMGLAGALGLFASIVAHELGHAVVARWYGVAVSGITLFIFGGVAEMEDEPPTPQAELWVAVAGPVTSVAVALVAAGALQLLDGAAVQVVAVIGYLATINVVLAVFNMVPAFPLDGGRILRAALWWWSDDMIWATRIAAATGTLLAALLIALGVVNTLGGAFVAGIWQMLLGFFIYSAASTSSAALELRRGLDGVRVGRLARRDVVTVTPDVTVSALVEDYFYRHHMKMFPVVGADGKLVGCVSLSDVNRLRRESWSHSTVGEIMRPCEGSVVRLETPMLEALGRMRREGQGRLVVVDAEQRVAGILTAHDVTSFIAVRSELGWNGGRRAAASARERTGAQPHGASSRPGP
jgi:Zn-dependent protease/CBS domain-containing protein